MTQRRPGGSTSGMRSRHTQGQPRQGVAARELQAARRKRRQREVMRNRIIFGVGCIAALVLIIFLLVKLFGVIISSGSAPDNSTITFDKSGKVIFEEVTDFDTEKYSKSDLKSYTKDLIDSFNDKNGKNAVTLDKLRVKGTKAYIKTTYKDADSYEAFTAYDTFNGSYDDAADEYDFADVFCAVADSKKASPEAVDATSTFADHQVIVVNENVNVVVPGQIDYVSDTSTAIVDDHTVSIKQADDNADATDLVYIIYTAK